MTEPRTLSWPAPDCSECVDGYVWTGEGRGEPALCACYGERHRREVATRAGIPRRYARAVEPGAFDRSRVDDWPRVRAALDTGRAILEGAPGAGKSHLAASWLAWTVLAAPSDGARPVRRARWVSWPALVRTTQREQPWEAGADLAGCDVLVLDDYGAEADTEWSQETVYGLVSGLYECAGPGLRVVATTNLSLPERLARCHRGASRLAELAPACVPVLADDYRLRSER